MATTKNIENLNFWWECVENVFKLLKALRSEDFKSQTEMVVRFHQLNELYDHYLYLASKYSKKCYWQDAEAKAEEDVLPAMVQLFSDDAGVAV